MLRNLVDHFLHHPAHLIQHHFSINYVPKQWFAVLGHNGHKIGTGLRIVKFRQTKVTTVLGFTISFYLFRAFVVDNQ